MINNPISKLAFSEAKELAQLAAIVQDFGFVISATNKLALMLRNGEQDQILLRSLFTAALVAYVRCFSSGKRKVLSPEIFTSLPGEPLICHQQYKDTRDKHIAHSVNPFEEMLVGAVLSPDDAANREVLGVACLTMSLVTYDEQGVEQLGRLARFAQEHVIKQCRELQERVVQIARTIDLDSLYSSEGLIVNPQGGPGTAAAARSA